MGMKQAAKMSGEEYVCGRRAGVEGTQGESRKGSAEKTVYPADDNDGGGEDGLGAAARNIYGKAVRNKGDDIGDRALFER